MADTNNPAVGRDLVPNADLLSLSQAKSGDNFQVVLTDTFQPILEKAAVQASDMIDLVVQLDCICNEEWVYTLAPDLDTAIASTSDKWWPVKADVEKILPIVQPQDRVFVKQAAGGSGQALALTAWGFKAEPPRHLDNTPN